MIPGWEAGNPTYRQQLHLSFLDPRVPWPLDPAWAEFLWWRGERRGEIEALTTWCFAASETPPFLGEAYLCQPHPGLLQKDLQEALMLKKIPSLLHTHLSPLPQLSLPEPVVALQPVSA